ncbi:hypothetical protein B9Z45_15275 [Limnohabitans sp. 2KL-17]|uniref:hypothetical protein n=1 Tax=Limnohabitans sp. 2KL-17 TaxID=1100704 RepID=UPI000DD225B5|nr:hypothetical protein [Limnohabitans sp. 2KL-17]PUE49891.1 hypothetical protein B9Z45_15275 [Limnohabitans sp. 2KL-17]
MRYAPLDLITEDGNRAQTEPVHIESVPPAVPSAAGRHGQQAAPAETYFDTPDLALQQRRMAVHERLASEQWLLTV